MKLKNILQKWFLRSTIIVLLGLLISIANTALAQTYYVKPNGSSTANGLSWANAVTIERALEIAPSNAEIWLMQGTYSITETLEVGVGDWSKNGLKLYGGFRGNETALNQRDWQNRKTILDGNNSVRIMRYRDEKNGLLDGITFQRGFVTGDNEGGGAIHFFIFATSTIRNCTFTANVSEGSRGAGAIYFRSGNFLVDNCVFENNRHNLKQYPNGSNGGGAIHNWSNKLTIQNSTFTNNHGQNGGSIYTWGNNTEIINCKFTGNKAVDFGGAIFKNNNSAKIENCEFRNNEAQSGGAISNNHRNISISRSIFENNTALVGGAIHHSFGNTTLNQIVFRNNTAKEGGAISKVWDKISVSNSLFEKNTATGIGGAIVAARDEMELANNTFVFNTNTAIAIWDKIVQNGKIYNSIFYGNTANTVYANANADIDRLNPYSDNYNYNGWTLELRRNILQNTPKGGTLAANQINVNPLFVNNDNDFRLRATSPAVDAGNNSLYTQVVGVNPANATQQDLANRPRVVNTAIDLGAYEFQQVPNDTPPNCTQLTLPANNATNVALTPTLQWNAVTNASGYKIHIGTTSGGNDVLNANVGNVTSYNITTSLNENTEYFVRIVPYNRNDRTDCTVTSFRTLSSTPAVPTCTQISNITNGQTAVPVSTNLVWGAVSDATSYIVRVGTTAGGGQTVGNQEIIGTSFSFATPLAYNTTYYVRITPKNSAGNASGCTVISFTTENEPVTIPTCTQINNITNGQTNVPVSTNLVWGAVSDATSYIVRVGTSAGGGQTVGNQEVTGTSFSFANPLAYNTTYYVRITPKNSAGNASGCTVISFTTENEPVTIPTCTQINNITNGQTNVPVSTNLVWNAVADATSYTVRVGTSANGTEVIDNQEVTTTNFSFTTPLAYNTTYYVRITPKNSVGNASGCTVISFTTENEPVSVPTCTQISNITNNQTNVPISTNLVWGAVSDATSYTVRVGTTAGGGQTVGNQEVTTTSFSFANPLAYNTTYYVQITPKNSAGNASGCTVISFTTESEPVTIPTCTQITNIANNQTNVSVATNLVWGAVADATSYIVRVGTSANGTEIIDNQEVTTTNFSFATSLAYNTTYYVQITPKNSAGNASGCTVISFTTENEPVSVPTCTQISNIVNNQTNVSISTNLVWNAVSGADAYIVRVGTSANGTEIIDNQEVTTTNFSFTTPLAYNTTYYVQITPKNSAGNASGCTVISFTTENEPVTIPTCTQISNITDGQTDVSVATNLVWGAVSDATSYIVRVGTSANGTEIIDNQEVTTTNFSFTTPLAYNTTYYVQITPKNSAGNATNCSVISFRTESEPVQLPNCTTGIVPTNNETGVSINQNLTWNAVANASGYKVFVGTTSGGTDIINENNVTTNSFNLPTLEYETKYFVRIIPFNNDGNATNCNEISFTTEKKPVQLPNCTTGIVPVNNATGVSINQNLTWNAVANASGYKVFVGTTSGGTDIINENNVTTNSFNLPTLEYETKYFVRIIPFNNDGEASGCNEISFTTEKKPVPICANPMSVSITINEGTATINVQGGTAPYEYRLDNGNWTTQSIFSNLSSGIHNIEVRSADGCYYQSQFSIIRIYNVITPNADGKNDVLDASAMLLKQNPKLIIFDRNSKIYFEGNTENQFIWDGKYQGRPVTTGNYWYIAEWAEPGTETVITKTGWILVKNYEN